MRLSNPYVGAFWSVAFADVRYIALSKYIRGFIFVNGEIYLNVYQSGWAILGCELLCDKGQIWLNTIVSLCTPLEVLLVCVW